MFIFLPADQWQNSLQQQDGGSTDPILLIPGGFCFSWWWFGSGESDSEGNAPPSAPEPAATALTHPYQASEQPHFLPRGLQMLGQ